MLAPTATAIVIRTCRLQSPSSGFLLVQDGMRSVLETFGIYDLDGEKHDEGHM